jgi:hypothetical protein
MPGIVTSGLGYSGGGGAPVLSGALVSGKFEITSTKALLNATESEDASRYSVTPPAGAQSVTVVSALQVSPTLIRLTLSATEFKAASTYTINVQAATVFTTRGRGNDSAAVPVSIPSATSPKISSVSSVNRNKVRVTFTEPVRQVSSANSDDALNPANYSVSFEGDPLTISSVESVSSTVVDLITEDQDDVVYDITITGVTDLAGNEVND